MGAYRLKDALSLPSLISLLRVPLAGCFLAVSDPWSRVAVLCASGLSDVVDGAIARRWGLATATGAAIDPATDKIFVTTVVVALVLDGSLPLWGVIPLALRDLAELPLVARFLISREARRRRADHPKANLGGKLATALQFVAVAAAMLHRPETALLLGLAGVVGAVAAVGYWRAELAATRA